MKLSPSFVFCSEYTAALPTGDARMLKYYFEADRPTMEDDCVVIIRLAKMQTNANEIAKNVNKQ